MKMTQIIRDLYDANPDGLISGTDLPSTRFEYRFLKAAIELIQDVSTADECEKVFRKNGYDWYLK